MSIRRGQWIFHRVGPNGKPFDSTMIRRPLNFLMTYMPYSIVCSAIEFTLNSKFNHKEYQLKPAHRALSQHVMVNDALPNRILSGTVTVKPNIERFTENGVIFEGQFKTKKT